MDVIKRLRGITYGNVGCAILKFRPPPPQLKPGTISPGQLPDNFPGKIPRTIPTPMTFSPQTTSLTIESGIDQGGYCPREIYSGELSGWKL